MPRLGTNEGRNGDMVTGWIVCHCGQEVPGYLAAGHVKPSGAKCEGIREELHTPTMCLACKMGTHDQTFLDKLEVIRWERHGVLA